MLGNPHMEIVGWDLRRVVHSVSVDIMEVSLEVTQQFSIIGSMD